MHHLYLNGVFYPKPMSVFPLVIYIQITIFVQLRTLNSNKIIHYKFATKHFFNKATVLTLVQCVKTCILQYLKALLCCFYSTMTLVPRATTTSKSHFCGLHANLQEILILSLSLCLLLLLQRLKWILPWPANMSKNYRFVLNLIILDLF